MPHYNLVTDFGADPTGTVSCHNAWNAAMATMGMYDWLTVPNGKFITDQELPVAYHGVNGKKIHIHFENCQILANQPNITVIHWSDCYGTTSGVLHLGCTEGAGSGQANVNLFEVSPELRENNTTVCNQNHNKFMHTMYLGNGAYEGVILMAGKDIGGVSSGCWMNTFGPIQASSVRRACLLRDNGSTSLLSSGSNSNHFTSFVINGTVNTGIEIASGGGNKFDFVHCEGITWNVGPNATPTGLIVHDNMVNGGNNPNNAFRVHFENVTRQMLINEATTKFYDSDDLDFNLIEGTARDEIYQQVQNDIETGDWTASLVPQTSGSFTTNIYNRCKYIKQGNLVTVTGYVRVEANNAAQGRVYLTGLPFTCKGTFGTDTKYRNGVAVWANLLSPTNYSVMGCLFEGRNMIELAKAGSVGSFAQDIPQYSDFSFMATYLTDD